MIFRFRYHSILSQHSNYVWGTLLTLPVKDSQSYTHDIGIQMNQKELTKTFMITSKKTLQSMTLLSEAHGFRRFLREF